MRVLLYNNLDTRAIPGFAQLRATPADSLYLQSMNCQSRRTAIIAGGGPSGLAAALMLHQRGWHRIIVLERNSSATAFDKNRGFNYLIDARGQKLLKQLGIADRLEHYGVENRHNIMTVVDAKGQQRTFRSPTRQSRRRQLANRWRIGALLAALAVACMWIAS